VTNDLNIENHTVSKSITMGLSDWARVMELAKTYKQKNFSRAICIAVRKTHLDNQQKK